MASCFALCSLGWNDTIVDGLYDVWGQFPEIVEIAPDSGVTKLFPSLEELRKIPFTPGDSREVHFPSHALRLCYLICKFIISGVSDSLPGRCIAPCSEYNMLCKGLLGKSCPWSHNRSTADEKDRHSLP